MEPEDTKPESEPVSTPAPKTRWIDTGFGCLILAVACGFAMFAGLAYGLGHASKGGIAVIIGAPIVTIILGTGWVASRHRWPK